MLKSFEAVLPVANVRVIGSIRCRDGLRRLIADTQIGDVAADRDKDKCPARCRLVIGSALFRQDLGYPTLSQTPSEKVQNPVGQVPLTPSMHNVRRLKRGLKER
jgi:hypothetical protein